LDFKAVAAVNTNGSNLVLAPGLSFSGPASLKGLRIGTFPPGTAQDTILKRWLGNSGVNITDVQILVMGPGDAVNAMLAGSVDGVFLPQPAPAIIEMAGRGRSVLTSGEIWPNHACCAIGVRGQLIREEPLLVEQIIKTHIKATNYANENLEEAARIYSNRTGQNLTMVEYSVKSWDGRWVSDPYLLINDTMEFALFQYNLNYTQKMVTKGDLFDTSLYDRATIG
jgi:NitT/TauT family transport system substrate-binding protein